jgi:hypothetical protein
VFNIGFVYEDTWYLYGRRGNPLIGTIVFFKLMLTEYLENISLDRRLVKHCSMRMDILNFLQATCSLLFLSSRQSGLNYIGLE